MLFGYIACDIKLFFVPLHRKRHKSSCNEKILHNPGTRFGDIFTRFSMQ